MSSLFCAIKLIDAEVWIVDNASTDGSVSYLEPRFPAVHFIANAINAGFGKANNQALQKCTGKFILFLNPDTILAEDCLDKCIGFLEANEQAGALGIRMVDGSGTFLPESKRSLPSPLTSFYKLTGLSRLFPSSKTFSRYALAYLNEHQNHEVDVLAGAFLMGRADILHSLNGFDETFFMYGEDIDLSYRIQKAGYKNYYFSESTIIHFKGESTRKGSLNYVKMFYQAMSVFVRKHYTGTSGIFFSFFIHVAIWVRATISAIIRFILKIGMPLIDAAIIYISFKLVNYFWIKYFREGEGFLVNLVDISLAGFTLVFLGTATLAGIYDNKYRPLKAVYAAFIAIIVNLAVYSLFPEKFRFSRGVILFGGVTALLLITFIRWLLIKTGFVEDENEANRPLQTIIVGTREEYKEVKNLFVSAGLKDRIIGRIAVSKERAGALGTIKDLDVLVKSVQLKEIIFCKGQLSYKDIISLIQKLPSNVSARFYSKKTQSIIGSDSKNSSGEYITSHANFLINDRYQRRMKRLIDICFALLLLFTFPVQIVFLRYKFILNALHVLIARKTWIGYTNADNILPALLPGVFLVTGYPASVGSPLSNDAVMKLDYLYAKNYDWKQDVAILLKSYKRDLQKR